jgi:hypothetical protein
MFLSIKRKSKMYCKCQTKHKVASEASGTKFYVCSKNLGGCGKEIGSSDPGSKVELDTSGQDPVFVGDLEYSDQDIKDVSDYLGISEEEVRSAFLEAMANFDTLEFGNSLSECPECHGGGFIAKLYPNGHTEESCEYCNGTGETL